MSSCRYHRWEMVNSAAPDRLQITQRLEIVRFHYVCNARIFHFFFLSSKYIKNVHIYTTTHVVLVVGRHTRVLPLA